MWIMDCILGILFLVGGVSDARSRVVDNRISYSILLLGFCRMLIEGSGLYFLGGVFAFLLMGIPALLGKGIGGADVKISVGLGLYCGLFAILELLLSSFLLGLVFYGIRYWIRKKSTTIPLVSCMGVAWLVESVIYTLTRKYFLW